MPKRDPDCIFCRIVVGEIPASYVHRGATATAFMDINPVTPGHLLVIPNGHYPLLADVPVETWRHLMHIAKRLATALRASDLHPPGINLFVADGEVAGQEVPHLHVHVIPRSTGDGFRITTGPATGASPARQALEAHAEAITQALGEGG
jgi:histidine triad (HIT) family protein